MAVSYDEMLTKKKSVSTSATTPTNASAWDAMADPKADKTVVRSQLSTPKANPIIGKTLTAADLKNTVTTPTTSKVSLNDIYYKFEADKAAGMAKQLQPKPSTVDRVANTIGGGLKSAAGQTVNAIEMLGKSPINLPFYALEQYNNLVAPKLNAAKDKVLTNTAEKLMDSGSKDIATAKQGASGLGEFAVDAGAGLTQLGASAALGAVTGGGALIPMALQAFGGGAYQAKQAGASVDKQVLYGDLQGAATGMVEGLSNVGGALTKAFGKGALDDILGSAMSKAINKFATSETGKLIASKLATGAIAGLGEGFENVVQDALTPVFQKLTYDPNAQWNAESMIYNALQGMALGGLLGTAGKPVTQANTPPNNITPTAQTGANNVQLNVPNMQNNVVDNQTNAKADVDTNVNPLVPNIGKPTQNTSQEAVQAPVSDYKPIETKQSQPTTEKSSSVAFNESKPAPAVNDYTGTKLYDYDNNGNAKEIEVVGFNQRFGKYMIGDVGQEHKNYDLYDKEQLDSLVARQDSIIKEAKAKADKEAAEKAKKLQEEQEYNNSYGFADHLSPMAKGKVLSTINKKTNIDGAKGAYKDVVWELLKQGRTLDSKIFSGDTRTTYMLRNPQDNSYTTLNKTEYDYANYILQQSAQTKSTSLFPENSLGAKITKGMPQGTGAVEAGFDKLGAMVDKYGAIPEGENPHSAERVTENRIPSQTADDNKVSQTVRTAYEAPVTTNEVADIIEQATLSDLFSYKVATDKAALESANATITEKGWDTALRDWTADVRAGKVSKDLSALGWTLYNNAANSGNAKQAVEILADIITMQRAGAQATQAVRLLKKMSPEYQLYAVQRSVQNLKDELVAKYGEMAPELKIDDTLAQEYLDALKAKNELKAKEALIKMYKQIAAQIPSTFSDKWNAWRYTAMLTNPVTHIKNIVGNYAFKGERAVKNALSALTQTTAKKLGANFEQTRVFALTKKDAPLIKACYDDYAKVADEIYKVGKYDDVKNKIADYRTIFGRGGKTAVGNAVSKTLGVGTEAVRKFNTEALDTEDMWVSRPAYVKALAGYLKANNATLQTKNAALLDRARAFAILEAQKAAYRDSNAFSDWVSTVGRGHAKSVVAKGMKIMTEGIVTFRRTPANILMRGLEYSPIGLLKTISYDSYRLAKNQITASEYIDNVSEGLTGTALYGLGVFLAAQGILSVGGTGNDKADKLKETEGYQKYSLNIGSKSYTIDWLAPTAMPLFMGAALYNLKTDESGDGVKLDDVLKIASDVSGPLLETSMLSSLNDFIDGFAAAKQQDQNLIYYGIMQSALSYLGQAVPTIGGRFARTFDATRRTSFVDPTSGVPTDLQYFAQTQLGKIPFAASAKQPYVDQWGRTQESNSLVGRFAQNFLSPGYLKDVNVSPMEKEIERLYEDYGKENEVNVLPPVTVRKYFANNGEDVYMTADEYTKFKITSGQTAYSELTKLTSSAEYKAMTDADKAKAVSDIYAQAAEKAKTQVMEARGDMRLPNAEAGAKVEAYKSAGISEKQAYSLYKEINSLNVQSNTNAGKYEIISTINKQGLTPKQQTALVATLYTSHDKETGEVTDESLLPYISNSARLLSLYTQSKGENTAMINMTIPKSFSKSNVEYELTDAEKKLYKETYIKEFNAHITSLSTEANVEYWSDSAATKAKNAVINGRKK